jgi:Stress responsive A/B Barrel Domain
MILHIVLFKWKEGVTKEQVDAVDAAMAKLAAAIPQVKQLHWGSDVHFREGNADWALAAIFANQADWQAYQVHPEHQAIVQNLVSPILASRTAIQLPAPANWKG